MIESIAQREVDRRARQLGLTDARNSDPLTNAQLTLLKMFIGHLEQAMEDEGVDPQVARNVVTRVITGGLPHPLDAQLRMDDIAKRITKASEAVVDTPISFPSVRDPRA